MKNIEEQRQEIKKEYEKMIIESEENIAKFKSCISKLEEMTEEEIQEYYKVVQFSQAMYGLVDMAKNICNGE